MGIECSVCDYFEQATEFVVYVDGESCRFERAERGFADILLALNEVSKDCHDMPAYGVVNNGEVEKAIKEGVWLEIVFGEPKSFREMPFEKLLLEVGEEYSGANLARFHDGVYEGRCFYLSFCNNMQKLYRLIHMLCA